jgi:hypothetical protein
MAPKVFISYSWTSSAHSEMARNWADRLLADGVAVVLDQYDLTEGHDKHHFMEKMVTDESITHVLVLCDRLYAEKADARKPGGVGTESQIISSEVYAKVEQSKFIPIWCDLSETGEPYLPAFMKSRIGINFSSPELVNENWERLVRLLFGKPLYQKPEIGNPPLYVSHETPAPSIPAVSRFNSFKQAFIQGRPAIATYRSDFLGAAFKYADGLRLRQPPSDENFPQRVLDECGKLVRIRDLIADWMLLEAGATNNDQFQGALQTALEQLLELRSRPKEITNFNDSWFDAHRLFVYETFLYVVAALLKAGAYSTLHDLFNSSYLRPETEQYNTQQPFVKFDTFWGDSELFGPLLSPPGKRLLSPTGELIKRQATREDLRFEALIEADLLALLCSAIGENSRWYPTTVFYLGYGRVPHFFLRCTQHKHFKNLSAITGIQTVEELRLRTKAGLERNEVARWASSFHSNVSLWAALNMDKLDTIQ